MLKDRKLLLIAGALAVFAVAFVIIWRLGATPVSAGDVEELTKGHGVGDVSPMPPNGAYRAAVADFSFGLLSASLDNVENKNVLLSPTSVYLALAMTANGTQGDSLAAMEKVLGGGMALSEINRNTSSYRALLESGDKESGLLSLANSVWMRTGFEVKEKFLEDAAAYYDASAFRAPFNEKTVEAINAWVKKNTGGYIDKIIEQPIDEMTMLYLINALHFDAEWESEYALEDVREGTFASPDGEKTVEFLHGSQYSYLSDTNAKGFMKPYKGSKYAFVALLPDEGTDVLDYASSLTGERFLSVMERAEERTVYTKLPKFKTAYSVTLNSALQAMGLEVCFDSLKADFRAMSEDKALYISSVAHKTYLEVDELGTRGGAVTAVIMNATGMLIDPPPEVYLDRPFVYAIVDMETNLPIFLGVMQDPSAQ